MKRFFIYSQIFLLTGCYNSAYEKDLDLHLTASYGQSSHVLAEKSPTVFEDKVVHFDGQHLRLASFSNLVNYGLLDQYSLRNKVEYFSENQGYSVSESHELILIDLLENTSTKVAELKGPVLYSPTKISEDKLFVQYLDNSIQCLDLKSYDILWERSLPDVISNYYAGQFQPLFDRDKVYFAVPGGLFLALDNSNGQTVWSYNSQISDKTSTLNIADFLSPKSLMFTSNGDILLHNSDGYLHCLSQETGLVRWIEVVDSSIKLAKHDDFILAYSSDKTLVCFDEKYSQALWTLDLKNKKLEDFAITSEGEIYALFKDQLWIVDLQGEIQSVYRHNQRKPHLISTLSRDKILLANEDKNVFTMLKK